jgi:hypothetical protein
MNRSLFLNAMKQGKLQEYSIKELQKGLLETNQHGDTLYHYAAEYGHLDKIPRELLTEENLRLNTNNDGWTSLGWTCFHHAAREGFLYQIPPEILTEENLRIPDSDGNTSFHIATENNRLTEFAHKYLTEENLLLETHNQTNCFHLAASQGTLHQIPKQYLTLKNLLVKNKRKQDCFQLADTYGFINELPKLSYQNLKYLKTHFKKEFPPILDALRWWVEDQLTPYHNQLIRESLIKSHEDIL